MACVAVNSLMRTIELEFLQPHPRPVVQENDVIPPNKELIQSLHGKLGFLIELFDGNRMEGVEAIKHLETRLRDVAFRVEDEIELQVSHLYEEEEEEERPQGDTQGQGCSMLCQIVHRAKGKPKRPDNDNDAENTCGRPSLKLGHILQQAIDDIDAIKEGLAKVKEECEHFKDLRGRRKAAPLDEEEEEEVITMGHSSQHASRSMDIMVGKQDEFEIIKEMLIKHPSKQLEVVSIKGMGGIGKTTLARRIYEDPSIRSYFDKWAWVVSSQHHNKRQMLLDLLGSKEDEGNSSDEDLSERLYISLKHQRYLVVMDDVWSVEAWYAIKACLPDDDGCGSRVLLTTRLAKVANHICTQDDFSYQMRLINQSESWNLFCEKAGINRRGVEFEIIGRPIVEKCKGLPLAISLVAGLFSKLNILDEWKDMAKALSSATTTPLDEEFSKILSFSYNSLPHNLKACFLHLGVFPEDEMIYAKDVARLWAVEGLIKEVENKSIDAMANRYIDELRNRNLIFISKLSCSGRKVKAFRMHDLVHAFCVREAQKEELLHVVRENGSDFPPKGCRWVSIQSADLDISTLYSSSSSSIKCRSIFCFSEVTSLYLKHFSLLRVFYFTDASMCKKIVDLVHLRYLPPVVRNFRILKLFRAWNLQTLNIYVDDGRNSLKFPQQQDSGYPKLVLKPSHCTIDFFCKNSHLKKVWISGERRDCNDCIDNLVYLPLLQRLCVDGNVRDYRTPDMITINYQIAHLKNLKSLSFRSMNFEWKSINVLCKLPKLKMLRLFFSGIGEEWELQEEDVLCELFYLEIFSNDLKHWECSAYNFPNLELLLLRECSQLREIPVDFADIPTLKSIELRKCLPSAVMSAKQIQEEQCDYGNYNMVVIEEKTLENLDLMSKEEEEESDVDNC